MKSKISKNNKRKIINTNEGFTLIELLVVVSIISLLSSIALATFHTARQTAGMAALQEDAHAIETQIDIARNSSGETLNQIESGVCTFCFVDNQTKINNASAYSLDQINQSWARLGFASTPKDPWGTPFVMRPKEGVAGGDCNYYDQVYSAGPDGYLPTYSLPLNSNSTPFSTGPLGMVTKGSSDDYVFSVPFYNCVTP